MASELTDHVKAFIVRRFACYDSPADVKEALAEAYPDVSITDYQLAYYNPQTEVGRERLGEHWMALYQEARERFLDGIDDVGIIHKAYRLKRLDEMERRARNRGAFDIARQLLEQAAKEVGGQFDKNKGGLSLEMFQQHMEALANAVVKHVKDPDALRAIDREWAMLDKGDDKGGLQLVG